jgi:hypothetical protein
MDDAFYKERARHLRDLAGEADPFIKKRLLHLANNYDAMITSHAKDSVSSNRPNGSADSFQIIKTTLKES